VTPASPNPESVTWAFYEATQPIVESWFNTLDQKHLFQDAQVSTCSLVVQTYLTFDLGEVGWLRGVMGQRLD
jgi:hypothetical protein